jgi:uncharacterized protein YjbJ (UPF0337 family)
MSRVGDASLAAGAMREQFLHPQLFLISERAGQLLRSSGGSSETHPAAGVGAEIGPGIGPYIATRAAVDPIEEKAMNWDQVKANWKDLKGKVHVAWGKLTDDDLEQIRGNREQLEAAVQRRYGVAKEDAQRQVSEWTQKLKQKISPRS